MDNFGRAAAALRAYNNADNDANQKRLIRSCSLRPTWFDTLLTLNRVCLLLVSLQLRKPWVMTLRSQPLRSLPASSRKRPRPAKTTSSKDANTIRNQAARPDFRLVDVAQPLDRSRSGCRAHWLQACRSRFRAHRANQKRAGHHHSRRKSQRDKGQPIRRFTIAKDSGPGSPTCSNGQKMGRSSCPQTAPRAHSAKP